jgi:hypothetical protein
VSEDNLQAALDYACGLGRADCVPIQSGQACFQPNTRSSHASYAMNSYYQNHANSPDSCDFLGTGVLTTTDPSNSTFLTTQSTLSLLSILSVLNAMYNGSSKFRFLTVEYVIFTKKSKKYRLFVCPAELHFKVSVRCQHCSFQNITP